MPELSPKIVGLMSTKLDDGLGMFEFLIGSNEEVLLSYKSVRDRLIVTNKKLLIIRNDKELKVYFKYLEKNKFYFYL